MMAKSIIGSFQKLITKGFETKAINQKPRASMTPAELRILGRPQFAAPVAKLAAVPAAVTKRTPEKAPFRFAHLNAGAVAVQAPILAAMPTPQAVTAADLASQINNSARRARGLSAPPAPPEILPDPAIKTQANALAAKMVKAAKGCVRL